MHPLTANKAPDSHELLQDYLRAASRVGNSARETYLAREALLGIMRLALAEQLLDIRRSVDKLVPASLRPQPTRSGKARRAPRKQPGQTQFVFGREN